MANAYLGYARDINNRSTFHVRESIPNSQASTPEETGQSIHRSFRRTFWRLVRLRRPLLLRIPVPVQSSINITALRAALHLFRFSLDLENAPRKPVTAICV